MTARAGDIWTIYCHTLVIDGRRYVGQTKQTMELRWRGHVREARSPKWGSSRFISAIRRYGAEAFAHEELEFCVSQHDADKAEARWIENLDTTDPRHGFNTQNGGTRSVPRSRARPPRPIETPAATVSDDGDANKAVLDRELDNSHDRSPRSDEAATGPPNHHSEPYTEQQLTRILRRIDGMIPDIERALAIQRELRDRIAARLERKSGKPAPPPPEAGGRVIPMRWRR